MLGRSQARRSKAKGETKETNLSQGEEEASAGRQRGSTRSNSQPAENLEEAERRQRVSLRKRSGAWEAAPGELAEPGHRGAAEQKAHHPRECL